MRALMHIMRAIVESCQAKMAKMAFTLSRNRIDYFNDQVPVLVECFLERMTAIDCPMPKQRTSALRSSLTVLANMSNHRWVPCVFAISTSPR